MIGCRMTTEHPARPGLPRRLRRTDPSAREELGLDRKDLADAAGISYSYLSAIESGQKFPSVASRPPSPRPLTSTLLSSWREPMARSAVGNRLRRRWHVRRCRWLGWTSPARREMAEQSRVAWSMSPESAERELSISGTAAELQRTRCPDEQRGPGDGAVDGSPPRRKHTESSRPTSPQERRYRGSSGQGLRTEAYLQFWTMYLDELERRGLDWAHGSPPRAPQLLHHAVTDPGCIALRVLRPQPPPATRDVHQSGEPIEANLELLQRTRRHRDLIETRLRGTPRLRGPGP